MPPCFDGKDGKEFSCAKCTGGFYLEFVKAPSSRRVTQEEEEGKWRLLYYFHLHVLSLI
jgi:hypothetical protein